MLSVYSTNYEKDICVCNDNIITEHIRENNPLLVDSAGKIIDTSIVLNSDIIKVSFDTPSEVPLKIKNLITPKKSIKKMRTTGWKRRMGYGRSQKCFRLDKGIRSYRPRHEVAFNEYYRDDIFDSIFYEEELRLMEIEEKSEEELTNNDISFLLKSTF